MRWQDKVPACFGNNDVLFAVHPLGRSEPRKRSKMQRKPAPLSKILRKRSFGIAISRSLQKGCGKIILRSRLRGRRNFGVNRVNRESGEIIEENLFYDVVGLMRQIGVGNRTVICRRECDVSHGSMLPKKPPVGR